MTAILILILLVIPIAASANNDFTMEEDSSFQTDARVNDILNLENETIVTILTQQEELSIRLLDGYLNITSTGDWYGIATIGYNYIENGTMADGEWTVNVTPMNDDPLIENVTLSGDPSSLANPVTYSVSYSDIDGDSITIKWYLEEEEIGSDDQGQRYIYPDQNNLTVVIDDGNGGMDSRTLVINTIPPEGWEDESDNTKNRVIFWIIFGTAGIILLAAMVWVLFQPESKERNDTPSPKENNAQNLPKNSS
jgi:hypothetical protein